MKGRSEFSEWGGRGDAVVITGIGVVSSGASSPEELWALAEKGVSPVRLWEVAKEEEMPPLAVCQVEEVLDFVSGKKRSHRRDRCTQLALVASLRAWKDAGWAEVIGDRERSRVGVVVGSSRGPAAKWVEACRLGKKRMLPSLAAETTMACLHGSVASSLGLQGPAYTVSTACSSGAYAIALGAEHLISGLVDVVVVGGADAPLHGMMAKQFLSAGILDTALPPEKVCRPFDQNAKGTVLGEASAFFVMEKESLAVQRNAKIWGRLKGWGMAGDTQAESAEAAGFGALRQAVESALWRAGASLKEVAYLNMHGTGTRLNDQKEMDWVREEEALKGAAIVCGSTKAVTGHCLGATPVLEGILCLLALQKRVVPPSANCWEPANGAPAGLVVGKSAAMQEGLAMSNSFGFWGAGASLLFGEGDGL